MPFTLNFGDIERICRSLGMRPVAKGSRVWRGIGPDGKFRQTRIHSHGPGKPVAKGTAKAIARDLLFDTAEEMARYLQGL